MHKENIHILISGGGTGGHIYPAIAIANALKALVKDVDILFVGAEGRMEMEKVPEAGYPIKGLWISGFQRHWTLEFPLLWYDRENGLSVPGLPPPCRCERSRRGSW